MQNCIKRVFSIMLLLALVLSCVPAVAFAAEAENTLNQAIASAQAGEIVKVESDADNVVYGNEGVILDLNGHDVNVTVAEGVTLYAIDSATDDYEGDFGTLTTNGKVAATVKTGEPKSYVTVNENGSYSFHRYYVSIAAISLKPATAALGYRAEFRGDETVKNALVEYGYELWANDNAHKTFSRTDKLEKTSLTLRLNNLLREGNDGLNAIGSTATVSGKAYMTLNLGGELVTLEGTEQNTTLRQVVEAINASASTYGEAQLEAVRALCTTYAPWMMGWATENIFAGEGEEDSDLKVEITVDVNAENNVLSKDAVLSLGGVSATVPEGTVLENGTTQLVLTITRKQNSDSDVTEGEGQTLIPLDVHIEGISADNTTPIIICLGNVLPKALNIGNYDLFHVENGQTVPMVHVSLSELDAHNEFTYDPATGSVTVAMASFSEIALRSSAAKWTGAANHDWYDAEATNLYIYNADQLWSFSQIVGGMAADIEQDSFAGKTIVLYADIDLDDLTDENSRVFYPIGYYNSEKTYEKSGNAIESYFNSFKGTFDGNGHTIKNFYQNTWGMKGDHNWYAASEQHYRDGMGLFGKVYGGTVKNLTVKNFSSDGEIATTGTIAAYADCGATFENIAIFNCNPRVYNIGNGGIVGCVGWYAREQGSQKVTFKNITVDNTNKISALWGSYDVACGGLVGQYYPTSGQSEAVDNLGIHMDNCHVAAQIDVYNDVCGNYMYYAYRYAGMLVGSVRENEVIDGREYPKVDDISAKDCTVHYGEWNHYYYCEFEKNGHPSYAQADEYKFSRVPESELVRDENGTVIGCTHEHTDVEDNRAVYLPFYDQLVTGYGWGVTSKGIADISGVEVLDRTVADSVEKFDAKVSNGTTYWTGSEVKVGELFAEKADLAVEITKNVQVSVSPVGATSTASAIYDPANTWTEGILTFSGKGAAEIIITDYYFCTETRLEVYVDGYTVRYNDPTGITTVVYGANGITNMPAGAEQTGKTFYGWSTTEVADKSTSATKITNGYKPADKDNFFLYAVYTYAETSAGSTTYEKYTGTLVEGDYLIVYSNGAMNTGITNKRLQYTNVTVSNNKITSAVTDDMVWHIAPSGSYWTICNKDTGTYAAATGSKNEAQLLASGSDDKSLWTASGTSTYEFVNKNNKANSINANLRRNGTYGFATYATGTGGALTLYKVTTTAGALTNYYVTISSACEHANQVTDSKAASCTTTGYTTVTCADCGITISHEELPVVDHNYVNGSCNVCGQAEPNFSLITDMATVKAGGEFVIAAKVGNEYFALGYTLENGKLSHVPVTVVNGKVTNEDAPTWTIGAYNNGISVQHGSQYLAHTTSNTNVSLPTTKYEWTINQSGDAFRFVSTKDAGRGLLYRYNVDYNVFGAYATSNLNNQNNTEYYGDLYLFIAGTSEVCDHETTTVTTPATCTAEGSIVVSCIKCEVVLSSTPIEKLPHDYVDGSCSVCGAAEVIIPDIPETGVYELVTDIDEITEGGKFVIVATVNGKYYAMDAYSSEKSAVLGSEVSINGKYVTTADAPTWIIGKFGQNIALQGAEGAYLKQSSADGAQLSDSKSDVFAWTILETEDAAIFHIANANEQVRGLVYRTGTFNYFRSYKLTNNDGGEYYPGLKLYKLVEGEIVDCAHSSTTTTTTVEPTCTATGTSVTTCTICHNIVDTQTLPMADHDYVGKVTTAATCGADGVKTYTCSACKDSYTESIPATGEHAYVDGTCTNCGTEDPNYKPPVAEAKVVATFTLGADGSANKSNSTASTTYSDTQNGHTLTISNGSKMYANCTDAKGNGCIKIGSSNAKGSFTINVPQDITQVVIYISKYNSDTGSIKVNGATATVSTSSSNGEYTAITIDTSNTKTITIETTSKRAMVNTIEFWKP